MRRSALNGPSRSLSVAIRLIIVMVIMPFIFVTVESLDPNRVGLASTVLAHNVLLAQQTDEKSDLTCIDPVPDAIPLCDAMARRILDSTVRVMLLGSGPVIICHGTVVGGRYVITHNHYSPDWPATSGEISSITHFSLALANGEFIVRNAPLSDLSIVEEPGMLLLDFGAVGGQGFFDRRGIPSAQLALWDARLFQRGREVAQVNWDGKMTYVAWVRVADAREAGPGAAFEVENFIELGASGGGVFLNGYHVANNWLQGQLYLKHTHKLIRRYSVAMANTAAELSTIAAGSPEE